MVIGVNKKAFLFPGQGSQHVGMGAELIEDPRVRSFYEIANEAMEFDLSELMLNGPEAELNSTENAQPAIFTDSIARYNLLVDDGNFPDCLLGHSLGEFSAVVAAGCISFEQGISLVRKRGEITGNVDVEGSMVAVLGIAYPKVEKLIDEMEDPITVANYNSPKQVVISGKKEHLDRGCERLREESAKCIKLDVTGPFHSQFMKNAEKELGEYIDQYDFSDPEVPVLSGVSGEMEKSGSRLKKLLSRQMTHPVNWVDYVESLSDLGVSTTVEVGPSATLNKLTERIDPNLDGKRFSEVM